MAAARAKGTHTEAEWVRYGISVGWLCHYCGRQCKTLNCTKDHRTPVSRGGSDALDNLAVACFACNNAKNSMTEAEFVEYVEELGIRERLSLMPGRRRQRRSS